ncbi:aminotransferase class I/II-fold pyridoxal phosphate-dependent enzyme [Sphingobium sp. HBC34]|uniref:Aminotransferase class I/II-fold pyridoxal phosphate-dependent enzyme n=1 Tax=Sphingobium cyanobacteriorum TaxID=3063954 RepID=A0ABT8ZR62_9SPHN|nr:aminotransferase class I/II-fold pyridoxal phosphate-dependent enzyme [Sphingobium sp. HBC34]MDO7836676.1 aminotransferase class I/II-fold pyridoxal phosphate-dependent enzyme [Sphingobium sp. HBC34]
MPDWTIHGGRLSGARQAYPHARTPWLDLSTGINPLAWPGADGIAIDWRRLPDEADLATLESVAAVNFAVSPDRVCALPGTEMGLRSLSLLGLPGPWRHGVPGYASHAAAFPGSRGVPDAALMDEAVQGGTMLIANPANPTGRMLTVAALLALARRIGAAGGWLVVDEAFVDAQPDSSILPHLRPDDPVIVLRSFGKFFGLAGVRLGFAVGPAERLAPLRDRMGSWPLSAAAIAIGTAAYADRDWIGATRDALVARAAALDAVLRRHHLEPQGKSPLFRLIVDCDAPALFDRLARQGIWTRPFDHDPRWLRLGVPGHAADLARLDRALAHG